jgi:hypothetical protein
MEFTEIQTAKLFKERLKTIQIITIKIILALYRTAINLLKSLPISISTIPITTASRVKTMAPGEAIPVKP